MDRSRHVQATKLLGAESLPAFSLGAGQNLSLLLSDVHLLADGQSGEHIMKSLKARRDEINLRKDSGTFMLVAAGAPCAQAPRINAIISNEKRPRREAQRDLGSNPD